MPVDNTAPKLRILGKIHVQEGGTVPLAHEELITFSDVDSTMSKLKLIVDVPPVFGYIMNSRLGKVSINKKDKRALSVWLVDRG